MIDTLSAGKILHLDKCSFESIPYHRWMPSRKRAPSPAIAAEPDQDQDLAAVRVLRRFRLIFNTVKTHFKQVEKKAGVGGAQLWALSIVQSVPGVGVGGLAAAMDIHQSTASNLVKVLAERGLIVISKEGIDRRKVQLQLLPAGARVLRRAPGPFTGVLPQALASLDARALARLDGSLAELIRVLGVDDRAQNIPLGQ